MDAQAIINWSRSWGGTELLYIEGRIEAKTVDSTWRVVAGVAHSALLRWPQWFSCGDYRQHPINYPVDALLAYLKQDDPTDCVNTVEQRKATEIAISLLVREILITRGPDGKMNYTCSGYTRAKHDRNKQVIMAVQLILEKMGNQAFDPLPTYDDGRLASCLVDRLELAYADFPLRPSAVKVKVEPLFDNQ